MSTKKPIVSVVLSDDQLEAVRDYQYENRVKSQSKAIVELILRGLNEEMPEIEKEEITSRQRFLISQYEKADSRTQTAVDVMLQMEKFEKKESLDA